MIERIGSAVVIVVYLWGLWQSILSIPAIGLGAASVSALITTVVAGVSLAAIWNWNLTAE